MLARVQLKINKATLIGLSRRAISPGDGGTAAVAFRVSTALKVLLHRPVTSVLPPRNLGIGIMCFLALHNRENTRQDQEYPSA